MNIRPRTVEMYASAIARSEIYFLVSISIKNKHKTFYLMTSKSSQITVSPKSRHMYELD